MRKPGDKAPNQNDHLLTCAHLHLIFCLSFASKNRSYY